MSAPDHRLRLGRAVWRWLGWGLLLAGWRTADASQATFQVDLAAEQALGRFQPGAGDTVLVAGTFSTPAWTAPAALTAGPATSNVWTGTAADNLPAGSTVDYKFIINPGGRSPSGQWIWESIPNRTFQAGAADQTLPRVNFNNLPAPVAAGTSNFLAAADCSLLAFFESNGIAYRENGKSGDALAILRAAGLNCVRLRLFTSSAAQAQADPYNYINNLAYTVPLAARVKAAGLRLLLDFHYSDTWADPARQAIPAAWTGLDFNSLLATLRQYDSNCISAFAAAGAMPDYVQVGNEITSGMLWPLGQVPGTNAAVQWGNLAALIRAAIQGIQDAAGPHPPKIIIHIDRGGDWATTQWFFDNLITTQQVAFDMIGESYYPFWHGSLDDLANCLTNTALRYGKPVLVAETAFPWTNTVWATNIYGLPGTPAGQQQYMADLAKTVLQTPGGLGAGIAWWAAEYQALDGVNEAGFDTASLFDGGGNLLPAAAALGQLDAPLWLRASLNGPDLNFWWPLSGAGLTLAAAPGPAAASGWQPLTSVIQNTGGICTATAPLTAATNQFFRLQSD